jgi:gamma-glutamyl hercynylcysteine S-oxide synthase
MELRRIATRPAAGIAAGLILLLLVVAWFWPWAGLMVLVLAAIAGWGYWMTGRRRHRSAACASADRPASASRQRGSRRGPQPADRGSDSQEDEVEEPIPVDESDTDRLVRTMLKQNRYALILRPQIVKNLNQQQLRRATEALDEAMAIVPEGDVLLEPLSTMTEGGTSDQPPHLVRVEAVFLDRYPVTNRQYKKFIDAGGYEQMSLWEPSIWPGVLDFVDQTGDPGPAFWERGTYPKGKGDHPVVGVCWYEALAYSRWVGKRLPSDPEWVKAGAWPVLANGKRPMQRKFPWGDSMDRSLTNVWGSGPRDTVSVHQFADGVSVGGVYQLIGNVWEWTCSGFGAWDPASKIDAETPMKSIRGGAYDTYFESQTTCQFQSGDSPLSRKHNIGFRCAVGMCDVVSSIIDLDLHAEGSPESPEVCFSGP